MRHGTLLVAAALATVAAPGQAGLGTAISDTELQSVAGKADLANSIIEAQNNAVVANNSVNGISTTGGVSIDGAAFQNLMGLAVMSANTGNNVAINSSLNVNVTISHRRRLIGASALLLWSGAVDASPSPPADMLQNRLNLGTVEAAMPVSSMLERKFATVVRQQYDYSCGSAALATLLRYHYDLPVDERVTFLGMWAEGDRETIRKLGFSLLDMKRYLAERGLSADGYKVSLAQIAAAQTPGIVLLDIEGYKHFVVVKAIDGNSVLLGDPSLGLRRISTRAFERAWNGIYFAINGRFGPAVGFNRPTELALAPSATRASLLEPVGQAALTLTKPGLGEL